MIQQLLNEAGLRDLLWLGVVRAPGPDVVAVQLDGHGASGEQHRPPSRQGAGQSSSTPRRCGICPRRRTGTGAVGGGTPLLSLDTETNISVNAKVNAKVNVPS